MSQATIYDVSRLSGVSTATVSRAYADPAHVRESTKKKVFDAAAALNYQPSAIARAMARQRTDKLAFIICKKGATILDSFYAGICEGVMRRANSLEYQLVVTTAEDWWRLNQSRQFDGAIVAGEAEPELLSELRRQKVRVVVANYDVPGVDLPCVVADEADGVYQALKHLADKGHSRIALLAGRFSKYIISERYNGFISGMKKLGLPLNEADILMCERSVESAAEAAAKLLNRSERPSAIFAFNDELAAGVMKAAARLGISIPDELCVVGCDDSPICTLLEPELTSVHIDCGRMGEASMDILMELLDGKKEAQRKSVIPVTLKVRGSS